MKISDTAIIPPFVAALFSGSLHVRALNGGNLEAHSYYSCTGTVQNSAKIFHGQGFPNNKRKVIVLLFSEFYTTILY